MSHRRRRRHELTLADKVEVIRLLESCTSQTEVARLFDCSQSQVSRIASKREEILSEWETSGNSEQKRRRTAKDEVADTPREWVNEPRQDTTASDQTLEVRTGDPVQQPQKPSFSPSPSWFNRWKGRNMDASQMGISLNWSRHLGGGGGSRRGRGRPKASANKESRISNQLLDVLKNYALCDVYAADELPLFYSAVPNLNHSTVDTSAEEQQIGDCAIGQDICAKLSGKKECITLFLACNVTGSDKRDMLVILDSNFRASNMGFTFPGCHTASSPGALMTVDIFRTWLIALDQAMRQQRRYILLLVNNTPPHEAEVGKTLEHVRLLFMRPYATPFFHGLSHAIRTHYRHQLLLKLFSNQPTFFSASSSSDDKNSNGTSWTIDIHEAVAMLQRAWRNLGPHDIVPCFSKSGTCAPHIHGLPEPEVEELPDLPETVITRELFEDFVNIDADVECYGDSSLVSVECHISTETERLSFEAKLIRDDAAAHNDSFSGRAAPSFVACHNGLDPGAGSGGYGGSTEFAMPSSGGESVADVLGSLGIIRRFLNQRGLHLHNLHALEAQIHDCI
ncbi:tigger transposable element-derived protein 3-like [Pomacea canaliculata]|uniref:tigger transposable element-derived protein 3-like n=1 Tax=Pomacea canaliculata TaxID=400727 RepID=UPI000D7283B5|nr:tigger transposable element-derived protein 3-like [Pomacea canaliculata]